MTNVVENYKRTVIHRGVVKKGTKAVIYVHVHNVTKCCKNQILARLRNRHSQLRKFSQGESMPWMQRWFVAVSRSLVRQVRRLCTPCARSLLILLHQHTVLLICDSTLC